MQEGRKCKFVILWEKQFCAQIFFVFHCFLTSCFIHKNVNTLSWGLCVFHCFLTSCFIHKNVNTLSWGLCHDSKRVILHVLSISTINLISPKMSLTIFFHLHDDMAFIYSRTLIGWKSERMTYIRQIYTHFIQVSSLRLWPVSDSISAICDLKQISTNAVTLGP